jgi:2-deoxy-D-gluconate 3-dehydrogenase
MSLFDLSGRAALITGGNGGIGLGMAKGLAGAGASVMIAGRDPAKNAAAQAELAALGGEAFAIEVDVTREDFGEAMVAQAVARMGGLDILINNAGISIADRPETLTLADWRAVIDTNLTSVFVGARAAYPVLKAGGGGKIINIGSMYSLFGAWYSAAYSASKGGVVQITKSLATAWAEDNIQVNAILPGWIDTAMTARIRGRLQGFEAAIAARTPAGRWGTPGDFAGPAVFLASAASDFVTGAQIVVDGGYAVQGSV